MSIVSNAVVSQGRDGTGRTRKRVLKLRSSTRQQGRPRPVEGGPSGRLHAFVR